MRIFPHGLMGIFGRFFWGISLDETHSATLAWDSTVNLNVDGLLREGFLSAQVANARPVIDGFYSYGMEFRGLNPLKRVRMERKFKKLFHTRLS